MSTRGLTGISGFLLELADVLETTVVVPVAGVATRTFPDRTLVETDPFDFTGVSERRIRSVAVPAALAPRRAVPVSALLRVSLIFIPHGSRSSCGEQSGIPMSDQGTEPPASPAVRGGLLLSAAVSDK
jgi:hypothetical protein